MISFISTTPVVKPKERSKKERKPKRPPTPSTSSTTESLEETFVETTGPTHSQEGVRYLDSGMKKRSSGRRRFQFYSDESSFESDAKPKDYQSKEDVHVNRVPNSSYTMTNDMEIETSEELVTTSMLKESSLVSTSTTPFELSSSSSQPELQKISSSPSPSTFARPVSKKNKKDRHAAFLGM